MAEKLRNSPNGSNGSKTLRPEIKREDTDKDLDDYFVCLVLQSMTAFYILTQDLY
jgi:hypothetical protein